LKASWKGTGPGGLADKWNRKSAAKENSSGGVRGNLSWGESSEAKDALHFLVHKIGRREKEPSL